MIDFLLTLGGMAAIAVAMLWLAWLALGDYRKVFVRNPRAVMSLELFSILAELGGPGYLAAILAVCGAWILLGALYLAITLGRSALFH